MLDTIGTIPTRRFSEVVLVVLVVVFVPKPNGGDAVVVRVGSIPSGPVTLVDNPTDDNGGSDTVGNTDVGNSGGTVIAGVVNGNGSGGNGNIGACSVVIVVGRTVVANDGRAVVVLLVKANVVLVITG